MKRECKYRAHSVQRVGHCIWMGVPKKVAKKNWQGCFEINSVLWTSVQWYNHFFFPTCHVLKKTWFKLLVHFFNESWFIWLLVLFFNIFGDDFQGFSETAFHCTVKLLNEIFKKNRKFICCWHFFSIGTEVCHCCSTTSWRNTWQSNF